MLAAGVASAEPAAITVRGRIVDASGTPVRGAQVASDANPDVAVTTDAKGRYALDGVVTGSGLIVLADGRGCRGPDRD